MSTNAVTISEPTAITLTITSTDANCGQADGFALANASGGTGTYSYIWSSLQTTVNLTQLTSSIYSVTVTDSNGCTKTGSVTIFNLNTLTITASGSTAIENGDSTVLSASGGMYYQWTPATGLNCATCQNPIASPSVTTIYCVTVTDINGCSDNACVTVNVELKCGEFFIPTAFSPNSDNNNDCFRIYGISGCFKKFYLAIYDRWGEKVFSTHDPLECWNGTLTSFSTSKELNTGMFVYYLQAVTLQNEEISKRGNISLIR